MLLEIKLEILPGNYLCEIIRVHITMLLILSVAHIIRCLYTNAHITRCKSRRTFTRRRGVFVHLVNDVRMI